MTEMTHDESLSDVGNDLVGAACRDHPCNNCGTAMILLGRLPSIRLRRSVDVYRCYGCDAVISMPRDWN